MEFFSRWTASIENNLAVMIWLNLSISQQTQIKQSSAEFVSKFGQ